jgi:ATP-dependent protease ClpP protease subunit
MFEHLNMTTDSLLTVGVESCDAPVPDEVCDTEDNDKNIKVEYGVIEVPFPTLATRNIHIAERVENDVVKSYMVYLGDLIGCTPENDEIVNHVCSILDMAVPGLTVDIVINTYGGSLISASRLVSAMRNTQANVTTIALGNVMSAGTYIWANGKNKVVYPSSIFMFHSSSHGSYGFTDMIAETSVIITEYCIKHTIDPLVESGILLKDEKDMIMSGEDFVLSGVIVNQRLSKPTSEDKE